MRSLSPIAKYFLAVAVAQTQARRQRPHTCRMVFGVFRVGVDFRSCRGLEQSSGFFFRMPILIARFVFLRAVLAGDGLIERSFDLRTRSIGSSNIQHVRHKARLEMDRTAGDATKSKLKRERPVIVVIELVFPLCTTSSSCMTM